MHEFVGTSRVEAMGVQAFEGFAVRQKIGYTVISNRTPLPEPFSLVRAIPCSFFLDYEGRIKLATEGTLTLGTMKAILTAE